LGRTSFPFPRGSRRTARGSMPQPTWGSTSKSRPAST
jgi:hypothetical protein